MTSTQYMLTLCELSAPARIRTPDSEAMRRFKFFMSRSRDGSGKEHLHLHMGYFASLAEARDWAETMRARFPLAKPEPVPLRILQQRAPEPPPAPAPAADVPVMTDTQVLRVLETRRFTAEEVEQENDVRGISLVGPDDTHSRRALKEAVAQGAPVMFAVQMLESAADISLANVPSLSIFRAYTLYKTTITREKRPLHSLRLGFFKDAISAKQVAYYVRSHFAGVTVVPVTDSERQHAAASPIDTTKLSDSFQRSLDQALETARPPAPTPSKPLATRPTAPPPKRSADSLEQTLELLAASEMWNDPDSHAETGVRHLKLEVQKKKSSRG